MTRDTLRHGVARPAGEPREGAAPAGERCAGGAHARDAAAAHTPQERLGAARRARGAAHDERAEPAALRDGAAPDDPEHGECPDEGQPAGGPAVERARSVPPAALDAAARAALLDGEPRTVARAHQSLATAVLGHRQGRAQRRGGAAADDLDGRRRPRGEPAHPGRRECRPRERARHGAARRRRARRGARVAPARLPGDGAAGAREPDAAPQGACDRERARGRQEPPAARAPQAPCRQREEAALARGARAAECRDHRGAAQCRDPAQPVQCGDRQRRRQDRRARGDQGVAAAEAARRPRGGARADRRAYVVC